MKLSLIEQIQNQTNDTIVSFLKTLSKQGIYTEHTQCLTPMLNGQDAYVIGTESQVVAILIDRERSYETLTLANEERFGDDQEPLWFEEAIHRVSPVYGLMQFSHSIRHLCRIKGKLEPTIYGVLLTQTNLINYEDIKPMYDYLQIKIFFHLPNLKNFSMANVTCKATPPVAVLMAEYRKNIKKLTWTLDNTYDRTAEEYIDEATRPFFYTKGSKKAIEKKDENNPSAQISFYNDSYLPEIDKMDLPDLGNLRAELIPPISRNQANMELERMVGCNQLKEFINDMCDMADFNKRLKNADMNAPTIPVCLNTVFTGNPGTGKTTAARLIGSLLRGKVLSKGHVIMASRSSFLGQNWGCEEDLVDRLIKASAGGVLMIDEAYMLMGSGHKEDPARLILPLMLSKLADERETADRMVILCGYSKPMQQLLETNLGLSSRFPVTNRIEFPDLNAEELMEMFYGRLKSYGDYQFLQEAVDQINKNIKEAYYHRDNNSFGNGRFVVNYLNSIMREHARRIVKNDITSKYALYLITDADVKPLEVKDRVREIGFGKNQF